LDLRRALLVASPDGIPLACGLRVHRALVWTLAALGLSWMAALALRFLTANTPQSIEWYTYGYLDKRWILLAYWLCVASTLFVPLLALRGRSFWPADATSPSTPLHSKGWLRVTVALSAYGLWLGPPWNLELLALPMEWHELVHLGPLQALIVGKQFYLESGTQYGPGMQMLSLHYLENFGISLLSFREFWLWTNFVGGLFVVAWMARLFPPLPLLLGMLAFRFLSPFYFFRAVEGGSYAFFFGSASCARYAGAIHAVLALGWVLGRPPPKNSSATRPGERIFLLLSGMIWACFAQLSQENLGCGLAGIGLLGAFAWITRAGETRRLLGIFTSFGAGFVIGILPILSLFAGAGELDEFLRRYFEIGSYIAKGYQNTPFQEPWFSPAGLLYRAVPPAALLIFLVAALDRRLSRSQRVTTAAVAILSLACFATALLRSDESHILLATTPVGLLVAAAFSLLLRDLAAPASRLLASLALLPLLACVQLPALEDLASEPLAKLRAFASINQTREVIGGRVGYRFDLDAPYSVFSELSLGEFLDLNQRIREKVGTRPVVISSAIGHRGHWYFFADLYPQMPDPEPPMTIVNSRLRAHYLADLDRRGIPCLVSTRPQDGEFLLYQQQEGAREEWILPTREQAFYVSCMNDPAAP
jgi:hypothetical protein